MSGSGGNAPATWMPFWPLQQSQTPPRRSRVPGERGLESKAENNSKYKTNASAKREDLKTMVGGAKYCRGKDDVTVEVLERWSGSLSSKVGQTNANIANTNGWRNR